MNVFTTNVMEAIGWTVLNSLWQGALVAGIYSLVAFFLRKKQANLRYWLAVASLALLFGWSLHTFGQHYNPVASVKEQPMQLTPELLQMIQGSAATEAVPTLSFWQFWWQEIKAFSAPYLPFVTWFWIMGVFVFSLRFLGSFWYLRRLQHQANRVQTPALQRLMQRCMDNLSMTQEVLLKTSSRITSPFASGVWKPAVLLPAELITGLPAEQLEVILLHELAHIKRNDYLVNLLQSIVEVLLFFHPAVWYLSGTIRHERELSCDDLVIKSGKKKATYAKALASLENWHQERMAQAMALAGSSRNSLLMRIQRIIDPAMPSLGKERLMTGILLLALVFTLGVFTRSIQQQVLDQEVLQTVQQREPALHPEQPSPALAFGTLLQERCVEETAEYKEKVIDPADTSKKKKVLVITTDADGDKSTRVKVNHKSSYAYNYVMGDSAHQHRIVLANGMNVLPGAAHYIVLSDSSDNGYHMPGASVHVYPSAPPLPEVFSDSLTEEEKRKIRELKEEIRSLQEEIQEITHEWMDEHQVELEEVKKRVRMGEKEAEELARQIELRMRNFDSEKFNREVEKMALEIADRARKLEKEMRKVHPHPGVEPDSFQERVVDDLKADGIIDQNETRIRLNYHKDKIKVNGKTLEGKVAERYLKRFEREFGKGNQVTIEISK